MPPIEIFLSDLETLAKAGLVYRVRQALACYRDLAWQLVEGRVDLASRLHRLEVVVLNDH